MIKLALDIGNTQVKSGFYNVTETLFRTHSIDDGHLKKYFEQADSIIYSNSGEISDQIKELIDKYSGKILHFDHKTSLPVNNLYQTPQTLGSDRIAGICGASTYFPLRNSLVIDIGTCITYDVLIEGKDYLGGAISLGLNLRLQAMNTFTKKLPLIKPPFDYPVELVGKNTKESIINGVCIGITAELNTQIASYVNEFGPITTILTGGDADFFEKKLETKTFALQNLVLDGLYSILNYNAK